MLDSTMPQPRPPRREVHRAEALGWLARNPSSGDTSVITSLPDVSELRELDFDEWQNWFVAAAGAVLGWVSPNAVAIFFQTDVRRRGVWIDKSHLVLRAADAAGARLLWHKIICREPPGTITHGRAGYSHLLCLTRGARPAHRSRNPDVVAEAGFKPTEKSMGVLACRLACQFLLDETSARVVVDPFCGHGTALAVANSMGLDAVGVDRSARACSAARRLVVPSG
jgi:hypothetical protein